MEAEKSSLQVKLRQSKIFERIFELNRLSFESAQKIYNQIRELPA